MNLVSKLYVYVIAEMCQIAGNNSLLMISDLPKSYVLHNVGFTINHGQAFSGKVGLHEYDPGLVNISVSLYEAMQRILLTDESCFLTLTLSTCAIIKYVNDFAVFSHSRSYDGLVSSTGKMLFVSMKRLMICIISTLIHLHLFI